MTPYQKRNLSPIALRMAGDMLFRNLAQRTIDTYTYHVDRFAKHFGRPLDELRFYWKQARATTWAAG